MIDAKPWRKLLLILGLLISIPLVIFGATMLMRLMERFPVIITLGAAILGWVSGEMAVTDPVLAVFDRFDANATGVTWVGHVDGVAMSSVTLVYKDDLLTGSVVMPGASYSIRPASEEVRRTNPIPGRALHVVTEVHQFAMSELSTAGSRSDALAPGTAGSGWDAVHVTRSTGTRSASRSEISSVVSLSGKSESKL